ncbi:hypothetical protein [Roseomonas indoligenes]|uniref:Uncharacterized protein n=1 Tax=Roseomonas indoligenes TaxID=2820811 RepID=A0A940S8W3_9PROT|nr:hypothetical protein [Pararoseomonas indoligenes]MBP0494517.1 hypothetical protein [Pararoseomonas indoligenes]
MDPKPLRTSEAFWLSSMAGAYAGITVQSLFKMGGVPLSELWTVPVIILGYGTLSIPFVALGLLVFGLPATPLLRRHAGRWWVGVVAVLWGALAGRLVFYAIDHGLFSGNYRFSTVRFSDMGIIYGVPTALAWWLLQRRRLLRAA